jgi:hypothetical protein
MGFRGLLVCCSDYRCSHSVAISANCWPDHLRLFDLEPVFVGQACGSKGGDLRPDFNWAKKRSNEHGKKSSSQSLVEARFS